MSNPNTIKNEVSINAAKLLPYMEVAVKATDPKLLDTYFDEKHKNEKSKLIALFNDVISEIYKSIPENKPLEFNHTTGGYLIQKNKEKELSDVFGQLCNNIEAFVEKEGYLPSAYKMAEERGFYNFNKLSIPNIAEKELKNMNAIDIYVPSEEKTPISAYSASYEIDRNLFINNLTAYCMLFKSIDEEKGSEEYEEAYINEEESIHGDIEDAICNGVRNGIKFNDKLDAKLRIGLCIAFIKLATETLNNNPEKYGCNEEDVKLLNSFWERILWINKNWNNIRGDELNAIPVFPIIEGEQLLCSDNTDVLISNKYNLRIKFNNIFGNSKDKTNIPSYIHENNIHDTAKDVEHNNKYVIKKYNTKRALLYILQTGDFEEKTRLNKENNIIDKTRLEDDEAQTVIKKMEEFSVDHDMWNRLANILSKVSDCEGEQELYINFPANILNEDSITDIDKFEISFDKKDEEYSVPVKFCFDKVYYRKAGDSFKSTISSLERLDIEGKSLAIGFCTSSIHETINFMNRRGINTDNSLLMLPIKSHVKTNGDARKVVLSDIFVDIFYMAFIFILKRKGLKRLVILGFHSEDNINSEKFVAKPGSDSFLSAIRHSFSLEDFSEENDSYLTVYTQGIRVVPQNDNNDNSEQYRYRTAIKALPSTTQYKVTPNEGKELENSAFVYITARMSDENGPKIDSYGRRYNEGYQNVTVRTLTLYKTKDKNDKIIYKTGYLPTQNLLISYDARDYKKIYEFGSDEYNVFIQQLQGICNSLKIKNIYVMLIAPFSVDTFVSNIEENAPVGLSKDNILAIKEKLPEGVNILPLYVAPYQVESKYSRSFIIKDINKAHNTVGLRQPLFSCFGSTVTGNGGYYRNSGMYSTFIDYYDEKTNNYIKDILNNEEKYNSFISMIEMVNIIQNEKYSKYGQSEGKTFPFASLQEDVRNNCIVSYNMPNHNNIVINYLALNAKIAGFLRKRK